MVRQRWEGSDRDGWKRYRIIYESWMKTFIKKTKGHGGPRGQEVSKWATTAVTTMNEFDVIASCKQVSLSAADCSFERCAVIIPWSRRNVGFQKKKQLYVETFHCVSEWKVLCSEAQTDFHLTLSVMIILWCTFLNLTGHLCSSDAVGPPHKLSHTFFLSIQTEGGLVSTWPMSW